MVTSLPLHQQRTPLGSLHHSVHTPPMTVSGLPFQHSPTSTNNLWNHPSRMLACVSGQATRSKMSELYTKPASTPCAALWGVQVSNRPCVVMGTLPITTAVCRRRPPCRSTKEIALKPSAIRGGLLPTAVNNTRTVKAHVRQKIPLAAPPAPLLIFTRRFTLHLCTVYPRSTRKPGQVKTYVQVPLSNGWI
jgi:hypothetical protein